MRLVIYTWRVYRLPGMHNNIIYTLSVSGVDFMEDLSIVTLRAGTTESCIDIVIINDDIALEGNETFTSQLSLFFEISVDISTAVVTIIDDEG